MGIDIISGYNRSIVELNDVNNAQVYISGD